MDSNIKNSLLVVGGLSIGLGVGYLVGVKLTTARFDKIVEAEVESVREQYHRIYKTGDYETPAKAAAALGLVDEEGEKAAKILNDFEYGAEGPSPEDPVYVAGPGGQPVLKSGGTENDRIISEASEMPLDDGGKRIVPTNAQLEAAMAQAGPEATRNVFEGMNIEDDDFVMPTPSSTRPYAITVEEYFDTEKHFDKQTFIFYEGDDVLADETGRPVDGIDDTVGLDALTRFGQGSKDRNVVYVRNQRVEMDCKIIRDRGSYQEIELGLSPSTIKNQKMRNEDE
jgi:hypothetical protein